MLKQLLKILPSALTFQQITLDFKVEQPGVVIPRLHSCVFHWTQALWKKVSEQVIILENGREKYVNFYVKADIDGRVLRYSFSVLVENI